MSHRKSVMYVVLMSIALIFSSVARAGDTEFTYQGHLTDSGTPVDGMVDIDVSLWDADAMGTQIGTTQSLVGVPVTEGVFSIALDFGGAAFDGDRWIEISINANTLSPRQKVTAAPYAIQTRGLFVDDLGQVGIGHNQPDALAHLKGGDLIIQADDNALSQSIFFQNDDGNFVSRIFRTPGETPGYPDLRIATGHSNDLSDFITSIIIRDREADDLTRVGIGDHVPSAHLDLRSDGQTQSTFKAVHHNPMGSVPTAYIENQSTSAIALSALCTATSGSPIAVRGEVVTSGGIGVYGKGTASSGPAIGVKGESSAQTGFGVVGLTTGTTGVSYGVYGDANGNASNYGVFSNGNLGASGLKTFRIDHPLAPDRMYLQHYSSEGPEPINEYSGNVILGNDGSAWVRLPEYFEAINTDFRYTLTAIGAPAPGLYVAREVRDNMFTIAGGQPGQKISWEVKARRNDPYVRANATPSEITKRGAEIGRYLQPELYGKPKSLGITPQTVNEPARSDSDR